MQPNASLMNVCDVCVVLIQFLLRAKAVTQRGIVVEYVRGSTPCLVLVVTLHVMTDVFMMYVIFEILHINRIAQTHMGIFTCAVICLTSRPPNI